MSSTAPVPTSTTRPTHSRAEGDLRSSREPCAQDQGGEAVGSRASTTLCYLCTLTAALVLATNTDRAPATSSPPPHLESRVRQEVRGGLKAHLEEGRHRALDAHAVAGTVAALEGGRGCASDLHSAVGC